MDWNAAIGKNREALKRILAMLVAMAEMGAGRQFTFFRQKGGGGSGVSLAEKSKLSPALTLPRQLHRVVLGLLRPAEAAARRLIIVAARGLALPSPRPHKPAIPSKPGRAGITPRNPTLPPLPLFDRLSPWVSRVRPATNGVPRISVPGYSEPFVVRAPSADDPVNATRLALRLQALALALDDLPGHAKRFARWRARAMRPQSTCGEGTGTEVQRGQTSPVSLAKTPARRVWPLRPGRPPGWRRKPTHEVHDVLDVVHGLAFWVLESPDTS